MIEHFRAPLLVLADDHGTHHAVGQNMAKINANYEALYILKPDLSEEQIQGLVERFKGVFIKLAPHFSAVSYFSKLTGKTAA